MQQHRSSPGWLIHSVSIGLLSIITGVILWQHHGWGAWGGDSTGYTFVASRLYHHQPIIFQDNVVATALEQFGHPQSARWLAPRHYYIINPNGTVASKYPIGLPLLMATAAWIARTDLAFYIVVPLCAMVAIVLQYVVIIQLFPKRRLAPVLGMLAAVGLALAPQFSGYALGEPMRDIPTLTALLLGVVFSLQATATKQQALFWLSAAGLSLGFAVVIRETAVIVLPGFLLWYLAKRPCWRGYWANRWWKGLLAAGIAVGIGMAPQLFMSFQLIHQAAPSPAVSIQAIPVTGNSDHIQSLHPRHLFVDGGKYTPGHGNVRFYLSEIQQVIPLPGLFTLLIIGFFALFQERRDVFWLMTTWFGGLLLLYGMWINPYPRYLIPLYPAYLILLCAGAVWTWDQVTAAVRAWPQKRLIAIITSLILIVNLVWAYQPVVGGLIAHINAGVPFNKAITATDQAVIREIAATATEHSVKPPLIVVTGHWKNSLSEQLMAHGGVRAVLTPFRGDYPLSEDQATQFFTEQLFPYYTVFIWTDSTTTDQTIDWIAGYKHTSVGQYNFTFQSNVQLIQLD